MWTDDMRLHVGMTTGKVHHSLHYLVVISIVAKSTGGEHHSELANLARRLIFVIV